VLSFKEVRSLRSKGRSLGSSPLSLADDQGEIRLDQGSKRLRNLLIGLDFCASFLAWVAALAFAGHHAWHTQFTGTIPAAAALSLLTVVLLGAHRLYRARVCAVRSVELSGIARSAALCGVAAFWLTRVEDAGPSLMILTVGAACSTIALMCSRRAYSNWLRTCRVRGLFCRPVCVLGTNDEARMLVDLVQGQPELGYRVIAVLGDTTEWELRGRSVPAVEPGPDLTGAATRVGACGVLVAASAVDPQDLDRVVRQLVAGGLHVQISTGLARVGHQRLRPSPLSHQLLFYVERPQLSRWQSALKRVLDVVVASVALLFSAPVLVAAAVAIKLDDRGPIFYRQERIGRDGRPFEVLKLRTMIPNASAQLAGLIELNERKGPLFKLSHDPRVTRVGRILRATSIDELPQFFNVLRAEMSLVGPRPALPSEVAQFDVELLERSSVSPGITGLWQVEARDSPSFDAYRRLDLFYVDNWSIMMDLSILTATFSVVIGRAIRTLRGNREIQPSPDHAVSTESSSALINSLGVRREQLG
jgi:exopolysaccharide biosynthesis polyprenyl glycosylphosphotransferase